MSIRDPVERAHSAYLMESARGSRQLPFGELVGEMLEGEPGDEDWRERIYLRWGLYDQHLARIHGSFDPAQVRVVAVESLRDKPRETVDELLAWLGHDEREVPIIEARNVATQPRSVRVAAGVKWFLKDTNRLKPVARRVVGRRAAHRMGGSMRAASQVKMESREEIDPPTRDRLRRYFQASVERIEAETGRPFRDMWGWPQS
jgi:hypothetical protein